MLLRGINVSGKNIVPMAELRSALSDAGFAGVATYIQSGNIGVDTDLDDDSVLGRVEALLVEHFGVRVTAVLVAQDQIAALIAAAPFPSDTNPATSMIYFPLGTVDVAAIDALDPATHPGDSVTATPTAVYVAYGNGQSRSKLTVDRLEKAAGTTLTGRNLRSAAKLQSL